MSCNFYLCSLHLEENTRIQSISLLSLFNASFVCTSSFEPPLLVDPKVGVENDERDRFFCCRMIVAGEAVLVEGLKPPEIF